MVGEHEILQQLGFSENESAIYLVLLSNGPLSVYEIASKAGIYRPNVYDKLEVLLKKGLVSYVIRNSKKYYIAVEPEKIEDYLSAEEKAVRKKKEKLESIMPLLVQMANLPKTQTKVEVFEGKEGLKVFLRDVMRSAKEVLITGVDDSKYNEFLPLFMPNYFKALEAKKVKERILTADRADIFRFNNAVTTYRFLPESEFNPTNTFVYGNKVAIVIWGAPPVVIRMENKSLAGTYRGYFGHLWKIAKRKTPKPEAALL